MAVKASGQPSPEAVLTREWRIPLLNATSGKPLHFGNGLRVRRATRYERQRWASDPLVRDVVPHRVLPGIDSVLICRNELSQPDWEHLTEQLLMVWFAAATLYSRREDPVDAAFMEEWARAKGDRADHGYSVHDMIQVFPLSLPVAGAPPWHGPVQLARLLDSIKRALRMFRSSEPLVGAFRFAFSRWFQSLNKRRRTLEDAVLDLAISLEALFIPPDERSDKTEALKERVSRFWFTNDPWASKTKIKSFKWKIAQTYDVRSRIAHGGIVSDNDLKKARNVLDSILRELFADFIEGRTSRI